MNLVNQLLFNYRNQPEKVCLVQNGREMTYEELYKKVGSFKKHLEEQGIIEGNRVLILTPMSTDLYVSLLSIWAIGAIACFMDAGFIKNGMEKNEFKNIDAVVGNTKYLLYSNINNNLKDLEIKVNVNIIDLLEQVEEELDINAVDGDFPAIYTYTSGTTGKPKIAERSHKFLEKQGEILQQYLRYDSRDIELSTIPIFTLSNIDIGITTVIADANFSDLGESNPKKLVNQIIDEKVNRIMASPGLLRIITKHCLQRNIKLEQVGKIFTGGGAVFLDFISDLKNVFPNAKIVTIYGSTEAEPIAELDVSDISMEDVEAIKEGKGILAGNIIGVEDCKIIKTGIDEIGLITYREFENLQILEEGEIVVTGENVLKGYVDGIGDSENKFSVEGKIYHRTGDMGIIDNKNRLWLKGRIKEPYFDIEAALHAKFKMGKTAVLKHDNKIILVVERDNLIPEKDLKQAISFDTIDEIKYVKKIPVDKRHSSKVDYKELRKILKME